MSDRFNLLSRVSAFLALFALSPAAIAEPAASSDGPYVGHRVVSVQIEDENDVRTMRELGAGLWSCAERLGETEYHLSPSQFAALQQTELAFDTIHEDVQALVDAEMDRQDLRGAGFYDIYHPYTEINQRFAELADAHPDLTRTFFVGSSVQGRFIQGMHIGRTDGERPALLIQGCQHAREWVTVMATTYIAEAILEGADVDPQIDALLDKMEFYIIPIVNPDGYVYTWTERRLWRKNRQRHIDFNYGVDLNRNWGVGWGNLSGSSNQTNSDTYHGAFAFSEPETRSVRDFMLARPLIVGHLDVHCFSQLVLGPWAYKTQTAPDADKMDPIGQSMASFMTSQHGAQFSYGTGGQGIGYLAAGTAPDWSYGELGARSYTYELRDRGQFGFLLPANQILPASQEALAGALHLADNLVLPCSADLNNDDVVDERDLQIVLGSWGTTAAVGDVTRDAHVGARDIAHLLSTWGPCP